MTLICKSVARVSILGLVGGLAALPAARANGQCQYEVTVVQGPWCDDIFEYPPTGGAGINEHGHITGTYTSCDIGPPQAFIWTPESGRVDLQMPDGVLASGGLDIAGGGQAVGIMGGYASPKRGFLYDGSQVIDLGTLPGGNFSQALAMNDAGTIVGVWGNNATGEPTSREAFIWQDGVMTGLGADIGTPKSDATHINASGQVTGWMGTAVYQDGNPYVWDGGVVVALPTIPDGYMSAGSAINNHGDVAGWGKRLNPQTGFVETRGFVWSRGGMVEIAPLPGFHRSAAFDINDVRQVVGNCWDFGGNPNIRRAFIWQNGVATDLNDLIDPDFGVVMTQPGAINNSGQIAGEAHSAAGTVAVILTPGEPPVGDLDGDCRVGVVDFLRLLANWGACSAADDCPADLDGDGVVNEVDFWILIGNWG